MAGTVTTSEKIYPTLKRIRFSVTSNADGDVSGTSSTASFTGRIVFVVFEPGAGLSADWDAYLRDDIGTYDLLNANGVNLSESAITTKAISDGLGCLADSVLTPVCSGMGDSKSAVITVFLE